MTTLSALGIHVAGSTDVEAECDCGDCIQCTPVVNDDCNDCPGAGDCGDCIQCTPVVNDDCE